MMQGIRKSGPAGVLGVALLAVPCLGQTDSFSRKDIKMLGSLDYGQTSAPARLAAQPPYCAYAFNGRAGDHIEITIQGEGSLQGFLTNAEYKKLAGGSATFSYTFDPDSKPGTYFILVSEAHHKAVNFTVDLERPSP